MKFVSTRGEAPALSFEGALLAALARDGGLYLPETWPTLEPAAIAGLAGLDYADAAYRVMSPYLTGDPCLADLEAVLADAYGSFHHPAVAPLRQIAPNSFILELFHGPTLAFKDLAMQVVARLMNRALLRKGTHATVIGATSGDTGAAAIEAFRGLEAIDRARHVVRMRVDVDVDGAPEQPSGVAGTPTLTAYRHSTACPQDTHHRDQSGEVS